MKTVRLLLLMLTSLCIGLQSTSAETSADKPNIIFILADDLGIGNVSCYGADNFQTPNIDAFAKTGLRFENAYACPLCGPSRAMLMTGRYAFHTGMTGNDSGSLLSPEKETMMPKVLKTAGYVTAMCGKWSQLPKQPADWGFDEYLRFQGSGKYWNTQKGNDTYTLNGNEVPLKDKEYLPDTMHNFVVDFMARHKDQPFYIYYAMSHVHSEILPTPDSAPDTKDFYKDNVLYMDKLVGKLLAELDRLHLREKTLIVFAGDNGTVAKYAADSTIHGRAISGSKGTMLEGGARVPCIVSWPGKTPVNQVSPNLVDLSDFFPTFASVAGAKAPEGLTLDGKNLAPQICGGQGSWPRSWVFVELGRHWYDREMSWKLNEAGELMDMKDAPFAEPVVAADTQDKVATEARQRLQTVLDQLNPAGGIVDPGDGSGRHANKKNKEEKEAKKAGKQGKKGKKGEAAEDPNAGEE
jgi:arylsulfatase A